MCGLKISDLVILVEPTDFFHMSLWIMYNVTGTILVLGTYLGLTDEASAFVGLMLG